MDEDQEAIARIRLFVDLDNKAQESAHLAQDRTDGCEPPPKPIHISESYALGSPLRTTTAGKVEKENTSLMAFRLFKGNLQAFLSDNPDSGCRPSMHHTVYP